MARRSSLAKYFGALHVRHTDRTEGHSRGAEASLESMHACDLASAEYKILWVRTGVRARWPGPLTSGKLRWAVGLKHNGSVRIHALLQGGIMCATWIQLLDGTDRAVIATIIFTSHPGASMPTGSGTIVSTLSSTSSNASALCTACSS